jgi:hypothetical protein
MIYCLFFYYVDGYVVCSLLYRWICSFLLLCRWICNLFFIMLNDITFIVDYGIGYSLFLVM